MVKAVIAAVAVLLAAPQQVKENPDMKIKKEMGVSVNKPPKNDEWEFKDQGLYSNSALVVSHKVDTVNIDITAQDRAGGFSYYDPKAAAENAYKNISGFAGVKDAKRGDIKPAKLPNGGAGNVQAQVFEMTYKKDDKPFELKMWSFVGKANQNFYTVTMSCEEGMYKKHQKNIDYILGTVQVFKVK